MDLDKISSFVSKIKFTLVRGQAYLSLAFWAFTTSNLLVLNLKEYFNFSLLQYGLVMVIGIVFVILGVYFVGYVDIKYKFYTKEMDYSQQMQPMVKGAFENTKKILMEIKKCQK